LEELESGRFGTTGTIGIAGTLPTGVEQANYNAAPGKSPLL